MVNVVYNKHSQRVLNLPDERLISIEPREKIWFTIENRTVDALPLFGDYPGPFYLSYRSNPPFEVKLQFDLAPSSSLFSPSDHLLLGLFNVSLVDYRHPSFRRSSIVRTLSLALNLSEEFLTIHRINGSMIHVYFSCDLFSSKNLTEDIQSLFNYYFSHRSQISSQTPLPLVNISIIRLKKHSARMKTMLINTSPRSRLKNVTRVNPLLLFDRYSQPLVLIPLFIIILGLIICSCIALCLCCHRTSSSSSTLLLPTGRAGNPNNKHLYQNYAYRKYREQQHFYQRNKFHRDQRQFISKGIHRSIDRSFHPLILRSLGIPVVFAEELDEKLEQTHTPLVMRIERAPFDDHPPFG